MGVREREERRAPQEGREDMGSVLSEDEEIRRSHAIREARATEGND